MKYCTGTWMLYTLTRNIVPYSCVSLRSTGIETPLGLQPVNFPIVSQCRLRNGHHILSYMYVRICVTVVATRTEVVTQLLQLFHYVNIRQLKKSESQLFVDFRSAAEVFMTKEVVCCMRWKKNRNYWRNVTSKSTSAKRIKITQTVNILP